MISVDAMQPTGRCTSGSSTTAMAAAMAGGAFGGRNEDAG